MDLRLMILVLAASSMVSVESKCDKTVLKDSEGHFQSLGYPSKYPKNVECDYVIKAEKNHYIEITFHVFEVQDRYSFSGLLTDFLEVFDGRDENRLQEATFYGKKLEPFTFISKTNRVIMRFVSDGWKTYKGFYATYKALPVPSQCKDLVVAKGIVNCTYDQSGTKPVSCNVTCVENYMLHYGDGYVDCAVTVPELPKCRADPEKLDLCFEDEDECPFSGEEREAQMEAFLQELSHVSVGRASSSCRGHMCLYNTYLRRFVITCNKYSQRLKANLNWNDHTTQRWKGKCHFCQNGNCGSGRGYLDP